MNSRSSRCKTGSLISRSNRSKTLSGLALLSGLAIVVLTSVDFRVALADGVAGSPSSEAPFHPDPDDDSISFLAGDDPGAQAPGACCLLDGLCFTQAQRDCVQLGGSFLGHDVPCDVNPCAGACCLGEDCELKVPVDCDEEGGDFLGRFTVCDPLPCGILPVVSSSWGQIKSTFF